MKVLIKYGNICRSFKLVNNGAYNNLKNTHTWYKKVHLLKNKLKKNVKMGQNKLPNLTGAIISNVTKERSFSDKAKFNQKRNKFIKEFNQKYQAKEVICNGKLSVTIIIYCIKYLINKTFLRSFKNNYCN